LLHEAQDGFDEIIEVRHKVEEVDLHTVNASLALTSERTGRGEAAAS
jgi:hypothetical protein